MTDNEIIKALERCPQHTECCYCNSLEECGNKRILTTSVFDLINRQKADIERLNKNCEELIYKIECLLCNATGNKFSKYTYTMQEMLSFVNDYIQDCCDEAVEETKATAKSEAIKGFAERFAKELSEFDMSSVGLPDYDRGYKDCMTAIEDTIDSLVKRTILSRKGVKL